MRVYEQSASSIIVPSRLPDTDYVVNPYTGCSFACSYCYASFMGRFVGKSLNDWGDYVYVKTNAVELFRREISHDRFSSGPTLFISSVTDAWQGPERKYRLARGILRELVSRSFPGRVSILTKSPLLLRDADLLSALPYAEVGVTVTTDDDTIGRLYEARAPRNSARIDLLSALSLKGIPTYAFLGPLMTHYVDAPDAMDALIRRIAQTGVRFVYAELMNVSEPLMTRLQSVMSVDQADTKRFVAEHSDPERRRRLSELVMRLLNKHGLTLRLGQVIDHSDPATQRKPGPT
jgi:DNA repair photolyase